MELLGSIANVFSVFSVKDRELTLSKLRVAAVSNMNIAPHVLAKKFLATTPDKIKALLPDKDALRTLVRRCRKTNGPTLLAHMANSKLHCENLIFEESSEEEGKEPEDLENEEEQRSRNFYDEGPHLSIHIIITNHGGVRIQCDGHVYMAKSKTKTRMFWTCIKEKTCRARITTLHDYKETKIGIMTANHTHEPDPR